MRNKQTGASMYVTLAWIFILLCFITLAVKIGPIYIDNFAVNSSLEGLSREAKLANFSNQEILKRLDKHFMINNVRNFNHDNIKIVRDKTKMYINIEYEVRTNIVKNIDAVVSFKDHLEVNNK
ncbi:DUF4845 domain-containing protein [Hahella sp. CCB-MM4]|uniref:DUF4845 domain-containing protein n=1 Tax=Hahella sp. (strain CCB-MM4) TaxID=1926491 RepID=UPI000B9C4CD9|nr:DUF4845 domain-containing protein [Hahella sp. CCB-MM4]OZG70619.1 DUF4845 domain-containing protein [Hahella sp. CCB-MM4]